MAPAPQLADKLRAQSVKQHIVTTEEDDLQVVRGAEQQPLNPPDTLGIGVDQRIIQNQRQSAFRRQHFRKADPGEE